MSLRPRFHWLLGVATAWTSLWVLLAARSLYMLGSNPHPFLPDLKITGIMLKALAQWGLGALAAYLVLGTIFALMGFLVLRLGAAPQEPIRGLSFRSGGWMGLGTALWIHGCLFALVPGTLSTLPLLRRAPMVLILGTFFIAGLWALARAQRASQATWPWVRAAGSALLISLLLFLPHDLFRRRIPEAPPLPPEARRLLVFGVDGLRQDITEEALPGWKAPAGVQPLVAVPATRLAWNMLFGGDPESLTTSFVIPYRREWKDSHRLALLAEAKARGLRTSFLIDDCTTLSFGLSNAPFAEVKEPFGGWKHFFTSGAGFTWPAYSWLENYLSPIETTNPWSEPRYFLRDIGRALERSDWVSAHTCQLHAPFFLRARELQAHKPWTWILASSRSFQPYQATAQAEIDGFSRAGKRADPTLHYEIRATQLLQEIQPEVEAWALRFPNLSGVFTSDHGEQHTALRAPDGTLITHLTGTHGFDLEPDTVRVPLHGFGRTEAAFGPNEVFSWFHLRDRIRDWIRQPQAPLRLSSGGERHWTIHWPYIRPIHILGPEPKEARSSAVSPMDLANQTYLLEDGTWVLEDPKEERKPRLCYALVSPDRMVTFTPAPQGHWIRADWKGYELLETREVDAQALNLEVEAFPGGRPHRLQVP